MRLKVLGCGDAFGSGGRFNTSFLATTASTTFMVDCGASTMVAMRRFGVDPNAIDAIFVSHLHGDHFGGLPFFLLDAQLVSRRARPLTIAGPVGLKERLPVLMEAMFAGSSAAKRRFETTVVEYPAGEETTLGAISVTPQEVLHPSGAPSLALRIEAGGRTLCYTGDTEWVETLVPAARGADLLIAECYMYGRKVPFHLDLFTLRERLGELGAKRVLLTHLGPEMLARTAEEIAIDCAEDGMEIDV